MQGEIKKNTKMNVEIEKLQRYASKILIAVKDGLVARYPFLARAVYGLEDKALDDEMLDKPLDQPEAWGLKGAATGTDGRYFIYHAGRFVVGYARGEVDTEEIYMHSVMHCLYLHPFLAEKRDRELWDLSCDIYIWNVQSLLRGNEALRGERQGQQTRQMQWGYQAWKEDARWQVLNELQKQIKVLSAQSIYRFFKRNGKVGGMDTYSDSQLAELFRVDDHSMWYAVEEEQEQEQTVGDEGKDGKRDVDKGVDESVMARADMVALAEKWGDIAEYAEAGLGLKLAESMSGQGDRAGGLLETLQGIEREFEDYVGFLQKFAVLEERMQVDMDAFDFIYYTYGLELFHDTPLIEPLEYKEAKTIHEFVIAIDTSGSCDLDLVRRFLVKTFDILHTTTIFWGELRIYIIQCDAAIQQELCITKLEELKSYAEHIEIHGRGGTDFRPVFERVEALREAGELVNLRGLLYFTDGYGSYPVRPTDYKTAFVFAQIDEKVPVPPWAMRIYIEDISDF